MRILDVHDDLGALFQEFASKVGVANLSDTVKTASWLEPASSHDRDFALVLVDDDGSAHRKYACHDPGSTLVSMFYLQNAQPWLNPAAVKTAAMNLERMASDWGLEVPVEIAKLASAELSAADQRDVLDERRVTYHPPKVAAAPREVGPFEKVAAAARDWAQLSPQERRREAVELVKTAASAPIIVPAHIYRYSGETLSPKFASHIKTRLDFTGDPEVRAAYETLAKTASLFPPDNVVDALYAADEAAHLRWAGGDRYGDRVADPVLAVYDRVKEAAYAWISGAEHVSEHDLAMFRTRTDARSIFTSTFVDELWPKFEADPVGTFKGMSDIHKVLLSRMARGE